MRSGYNIDTLMSVDLCESVKKGRKVNKIYEAVIYRNNFKISTFRKIIEKLFAVRQKYKDEKKRFFAFLQVLVKLFMNILYKVQIRRGINESYYCKSKN